MTSLTYPRQRVVQGKSQPCPATCQPCVLGLLLELPALKSRDPHSQPQCPPLIQGTLPQPHHKQALESPLKPLAEPEAGPQEDNTGKWTFISGGTGVLTFCVFRCFSCWHEFLM